MKGLKKTLSEKKSEKRKIADDNNDGAKKLKETADWKVDWDVYNKNSKNVILTHFYLKYDHYFQLQLVTFCWSCNQWYRSHIQSFNIFKYDYCGECLPLL